MHRRGFFRALAGVLVAAPAATALVLAAPKTVQPARMIVSPPFFSPCGRDFVSVVRIAAPYQREMNPFLSEGHQLMTRSQFRERFFVALAKQVETTVQFKEPR
jgi:hypothetical protein